MRLKRGLLAGIALCCMPLMTACSAKDTIGILVGNNSEDTKKEEVTVDLNAAILMTVWKNHRSLLRWEIRLHTICMRLQMR